MRDHDVTTLTGPELERARRELAAGLALARPHSPARAPLTTRVRAIDAELTARAAPPGRLARLPAALTLASHAAG